MGAEKGVFFFSKGFGSLIRYSHDMEDPASLSHDSVWEVLRDRTGHLWVGTQVGLDRMEGNRGSFVHYGLGMRGDGRQQPFRINTLFEDRSGGLWVGSEHGGLFLLDREKGSSRRFINEPDNPLSLSESSIRSILRTVAAFCGWEPMSAG